MKPSNILERAKQGDPKTIAALMQRSLQPKGISVQVARKDQNLHILLESPQIPDQKSLVAFIHQGLTKFGIQSIKTVKIYGRQLGQAPPVWTQTIELGKADSFLGVQETSAATNWPVIASEISESLASSIPASDRNLSSSSLRLNEIHSPTTLEPATESNTLLADNESEISPTISPPVDPSSIKWPSEVMVKETVMENHSQIDQLSQETDNEQPLPWEESPENLPAETANEISLTEQVVPPPESGQDRDTEDDQASPPQWIQWLDKPLGKTIMILFIYLGAFAIALPLLFSQKRPTPEATAPTPTSEPIATTTATTLTPPTPAPVNTSWQQGINTAIRAATLNQSAQTQSEWNTVVSTWGEAIALMKTVPADNPNYKNAQQKIVEYQKYLDYARERANLSNN